MSVSQEEPRPQWGVAKQGGIWGPPDDYFPRFGVHRVTHRPSLELTTHHAQVQEKMAVTSRPMKVLLLT